MEAHLKDGGQIRNYESLVLRIVTVISKFLKTLNIRVETCSFFDPSVDIHIFCAHFRFSMALTSLNIGLCCPLVDI